MNLWTSEDINRILLQLDDMGLPFSKYRLVRDGEKLHLLGKGGSANVYETCKRKGSKKSYALKVLGFAETSADSASFLEAAEVQKELGSFQNNVISVYEYTELWVTLDASDQVIMAEKGKPETLPPRCLKLQFVLLEKAVPVIVRTKAGNIRMTPEKLGFSNEAEILKLALDIGGALRDAHQKKVLHRDVKLENVFYSPKEKQYKLGDYGIAKKTEDGFAGTIAFTKGYAAPEVRGTPDNDRYDVTADIYSFGMMLYVLANGLRFPDSGTYNVNPAVQYREGYILPRIESGLISDGLYEVLVKACMYDPDLRYQSMDEMLTDIRKLNYSKGTGHKIEHNRASLAAGLVFLLAGVMAWKITMAPDLSLLLSTLQYLFWICAVSKGVLKAFKKETYLISFTMLVIGSYLLVSGEFTWWKGILYFWVILSSGGSSAVIGGTLLLINAMTLYQAAVKMDWNSYVEYSWITITFLSFAGVLLLQYTVLALEDRKITKLYYQKNIYWIVVCLGYFSLLMTGRMSIDMPQVFLKIYGENIMALFHVIQPVKIGLTGMAVSLIWIIRERVIITFEKNSPMQ